MTTENVNAKIYETLTELFKGRDSALNKYAKVRHTQYEMGLWCNHKYPLRLVDASTKAYFSKAFLGGVKIDKADEATLRKGFTNLDHAVKDGCHGRCYRLVEDLNQELTELGLRPVENIDKFLDWLTFDYTALYNHDGEPLEEKPYGFPILVFNDEKNRKELWDELQLIMRGRRMSSMRYAASIVLSKRRNTVSTDTKKR